MAKRLLPSGSWTAGIVALTVAFALGQPVGPVLAGLLSDMTGTVSAGLSLSSALLAASLLMALAQRLS